MIRKGILLAGGRGTRLWPMTAVVNKHLQPVYDKPMIFYPLTTLMVAGIERVLLVGAPEDLPHYHSLLGDGTRWGIQLSYAAQDEPRGIADALCIGADFIGADGVMLMLGDNLIYGRLDFLRAAVAGTTSGATIFAHHVGEPERFGVVSFDAAGRAISLEEKPAKPRSHWAVPGMYLYGPGVAEHAHRLNPSPRGELEITDLNRGYLERDELTVEPMGRGIAWFDTGTPESLLDAAHFVRAIQTQQGLVVGSPEEAAWRMGYISAAQLGDVIAALPPSGYRDFLDQVLERQVAGSR